MQSIGRAVLRKEARSKVTGQARYVDDVVLPGMIHGVTVRSGCPRGRITGIHYEPGIPWDEMTVVTAADIPSLSGGQGQNTISLILDDQPCLADREIRHPEEAVVLLAHPDRRVVERARQRVRVEVEPLPAVLSIDESLARKAVIWGEDNIFKEYWIRKGDVDAALAAADVVVEGEYETGAQEQLYIENNGMIGVFSPGEGAVVYGSMQCPY